TLQERRTVTRLSLFSTMTTMICFS
ncbi:V-type ATPase, D subunit protein, partial [Toxoplasma gondii ARI]